jgi:hypothetical protein
LEDHLNGENHRWFFIFDKKSTSQVFRAYSNGKAFSFVYNERNEAKMNTNIYKIIVMKESRGEPLIERDIFFGGLSFLLFLNKTIESFNYLRTKRKYGWKN